jgi:type I restriction enzyme S subunit
MKKGWKVKRLGELGAAIREQAKIVADQEYELWSVPSFETGTPETSFGKGIGSAKLLVRPNDVLICKINPRINRVWLVEEPVNGREQIGSTEWLVFRANPDAGLSPTWLIHFVSAPKFREWIESEVTGATGSHTRAKADGILRQEIPVPPLAEQQRIVGLLDEAFEGLATAKANAEKNLQNARALFESHLQSVFTQRGRGWVEKRLGELCERITKGSSPKWQGISYVDAPGILFVTSENVGEYDILLGQPKYVEEKFNAKDKKSILKNGDVLTNIVGASIGRTAVFDRDDVANINQAVCLIRCEPNLLDNYYLAYLLNSPVFKQVLHDNEVNNARANLSLGFFSQLPVPMPPILKQKEIVAKLDAFRAETQRIGHLYQRKHAALEALKKSLLHQAFTGAL